MVASLLSKALILLGYPLQPPLFQSAPSQQPSSVCRPAMQVLVPVQHAQHASHQVQGGAGEEVRPNLRGRGSHEDQLHLKGAHHLRDVPLQCSSLLHRLERLLHKLPQEPPCGLRQCEAEAGEAWGAVPRCAMHGVHDVHAVLRGRSARRPVNACNAPNRVSHVTLPACKPSPQ